MRPWESLAEGAAKIAFMLILICLIIIGWVNLINECCTPSMKPECREQFSTMNIKCDEGQTIERTPGGTICRCPTPAVSAGPAAGDQ